tara:strand:- start:292 stop:648 length:357 start_codon:yes stop_codon:yes gene_type:complete
MLGMRLTGNAKIGVKYPAGIPLIDKNVFAALAEIIDIKWYEDFCPDGNESAEYLTLLRSQPVFQDKAAIECVVREKVAVAGIAIPLFIGLDFLGWIEKIQDAGGVPSSAYVSKAAICS